MGLVRVGGPHQVSGWGLVAWCGLVARTRSVLQFGWGLGAGWWPAPALRCILGAWHCKQPDRRNSSEALSDQPTLKLSTSKVRDPLHEAGVAFPGAALFASAGGTSVKVQ